MQRNLRAVTVRTPPGMRYTPDSLDTVPFERLWVGQCEDDLLGDHWEETELAGRCARHRSGAAAHGCTQPWCNTGSGTHQLADSAGRAAGLGAPFDGAVKAGLCLRALLHSCDAPTIDGCNQAGQKTCGGKCGALVQDGRCSGRIRAVGWCTPRPPSQLAPPSHLPLRR